MHVIQTVQGRFGMRKVLYQKNGNSPQIINKIIVSPKSSRMYWEKELSWLLKLLTVNRNISILITRPTQEKY